jgi:T-complex protein 1 subunit zeta
MKRDLRHCYIIALNVSLEFENTEVNTTFAATTTAERERLAIAERKLVTNKVQRIVDLKNEVCKNGGRLPGREYEGNRPTVARTAVQGRNRSTASCKAMEYGACGGREMNSVENLSRENLGFAGHVWETAFGED